MLTPLPRATTTAYRMDLAAARGGDKAAAEAERGPARFIIPFPVNPIGMPEYDNGERFDLRLPYVDNGWVDEDADVMGKLGRWLTGKGGKEEEEK